MGYDQQVSNRAYQAILTGVRSGRKQSRREGFVADVKSAARELTPEAMDTLKEAMADQRAPWAAKITAAIAVLDRGWGKPTQQVAANVSFFDQMSDEEQRIMLAALDAIRDA